MFDSNSKESDKNLKNGGKEKNSGKQRKKQWEPFILRIIWQILWFNNALWNT